MADDFYLNLVDWSVSNVLCVALQSAVYLWEATSCNITQLPISRAPDAASSLVCGVQWAPDGQHLSLGFNDGSVEVWDVEAQQVVQTWKDHTQRVGALSWAGGETCVVASGSKDAAIRLRDLRDPTAFSTLRCHEQEVCGLRWSPNSYHLASGGNDNQVLVWDRRWIASEQRTSQSGSSSSATNAWAGHAPRATPMLYLNQHTAAVKALAWNPVQPSLLASGGGTDDRTLRFWNTQTGDCLHSLDTGSQVCGVLWSRSGTELVSSHGFSMNQLSIWKYPSLRKVIDLTGHTSRVLHLCLAADGEVVVSAAGDETIRFWRCFPPQPSPASASAAPGSGFSARRGHGLGSGSPTSKPTAGSPYLDPYGSPDEAAGSGRRGSGAAAAAAAGATAAGGMHSPWSRYTSPLAGSRLTGMSPKSGGRGQLLDAPRFTSEEDMALR